MNTLLPPPLKIIGTNLESPLNPTFPNVVALTLADQIKEKQERMARKPSDATSLEKTPVGGVGSGTLQDQLRAAQLKKRGGGGDGGEVASPLSSPEKKQAVEEGTSFQDQLRNRLKKRQDGDGKRERERFLNSLYSHHHFTLQSTRESIQEGRE